MNGGLAVHRLANLPGALEAGIFKQMFFSAQPCTYSLQISRNQEQAILRDFVLAVLVDRRQLLFALMITAAAAATTAFRLEI